MAVTAEKVSSDLKDLRENRAPLGILDSPVRLERRESRAPQAWKVRYDNFFQSKSFLQ